jgi:hypothetical protein
MYGLAQQGVIIGSLIQISCLIAIVAISVLKPWGRRLVKQSKQIEQVVSSNG